MPSATYFPKYCTLWYDWCVCLHQNPPYLQHIPKNTVHYGMIGSVYPLKPAHPHLKEAEIDSAAVTTLKLQRKVMTRCRAKLSKLWSFEIDLI
jgi:hypothetical protein